MQSKNEEISGSAAAERRPAKERKPKKEREPKARRGGRGNKKDQMVYRPKTESAEAE